MAADRVLRAHTGCACVVVYRGVCLHGATLTVCVGCVWGRNKPCTGYRPGCASLCARRVSVCVRLFMAGCVCPCGPAPPRYLRAGAEAPLSHGHQAGRWALPGPARLPRPPAVPSASGRAAVAERPCGREGPGRRAGEPARGRSGGRRGWAPSGATPEGDEGGSPMTPLPRLPRPSHNPSPLSRRHVIVLALLKGWGRPPTPCLCEAATRFLPCRCQNRYFLRSFKAAALYELVRNEIKCWLGTFWGDLGYPGGLACTSAAVRPRCRPRVWQLREEDESSPSPPAATHST